MELTYEQLFDALRREKSRDELQQLETGFYSAAQALLAEKEAGARSSGKMTAAAQRAQIEYQNARRILRELYDRRERKIVTLALHRIRADAAVIDTGALLPEEKELFDRFVSLLTERRVTLLREVEEEPVRRPEVKVAPVQQPPAQEPVAPASPSHETAGARVTFTAAVPKFVGKDLTVYGPFEAGASAELPEDVATILVKKGRASRS